MKILIICPYFFEPHRWMISAYKTALFLSKSHEVVVLTTGQPAYEKLSPTLTVYRMRDLFIPDPVNYSLVPGLPFTLWKVIRKERPTHFLVNKHMFFTSLAIPLLRLAGKKVVTATDTFPGITWFPRNPAVKVVMRIYAWAIGLPLLWLSNRVVLFHSGLVKTAQQYHLRYQVIPNGVDLEALDSARPNLQLEDRSLTTVLYVGRLESIKGYDDIIAVAQEMTQANPKLRFIFTGSTHGKEALVQEVSTERILFLGHRTDVPSIMKACDIFVLASYSEGLPNALMEAMACGLACVSSEVGGVSDLITEGKEGLLFPAGDRAGLCKQLENLIVDPKFRSRLGKEARAKIEKQYSWSQIAAQYEQLFSSLS